MEKKSAPLKDICWTSLCKYDWRTKKIWSALNEYTDITCVALVDDRFICAAMADGRLRIYRCPADSKYYQ